MADSASRRSATVTKTLSLAVGGYIIYNLWKKWKYSTTNIIIKSLYVYPVKSCKGFEVKKWKLSKYGMKYDREWLIYSPKTKRRVSQREVNTMSLICAKLIFSNDNDTDIGCVTGIQLSAPNMDDIYVPIADEFDSKNQVENIKVFMDKVNGIDQGDKICEWLTNYLNKNNNKTAKEYRLMRISSKYYRGLNNSEKKIVITNKNVPNTLIDSTLPPYSDAYPLLIVSDSSLNEINKRLKKKNCQPIKINRFRPNIYIQSNEAFIEDKITKLIYNKNTIFYLRAPCPRCIMPTINQMTGIMNKNKEPRITLKQFRTGKHLGFDEEYHEELFFGMFAVHNNYDVFIHQGDSMIPQFHK